MLKALLLLLMSESPAMNAKMDVVAMIMFNGTKNTPAQHSGAITLSDAVRMVGAVPGGTRTHTHHADTENGRMLTEAIEREVAGSKLVLKEGALADLSQH